MESLCASQEEAVREYRPDGLYVYGPASIRCALAFLIYYTHCAITASAPDAERRQNVVYRGRLAEQAREWERGGADEDAPMADKYRAVLDSFTPRPLRSGHPFYSRPLKPATSGRRGKAA